MFVRATAQEHNFNIEMDRDVRFPKSVLEESTVQVTILDQPSEQSTPCHPWKSQQQAEYEPTRSPWTSSLAGSTTRTGLCGVNRF
jgi:hypothetical protein